jgi:agmatinase
MARLVLSRALSTASTIGLLGVPVDKQSSFLTGPSLAPAHIRKSLWSDSSNTFSELGHDIAPHICDQGDTEVDADFHAIAERVRSAASANDQLIVLGGDHSISFPSFSGVVAGTGIPAENWDIVHIDAHPDLYHDFEGNPYSHASPFARILESATPRSLLQIGIRGQNAHQRDQAAAFGVNAIPMTHMPGCPLALAQLVRDSIPPHNADSLHPVYLSIDIDALDPAYAPGVSHLEPGGMSTRQLIAVIHQLRGRLRAADVVELNPPRDRNEMTAAVAAKFVKEIAGSMLTPAVAFMNDGEQGDAVETP